MEKRYFIQVYGCQMNIHEAEKLAGMLENLGYEKTQTPETASLIIYVTCCIRENAEQKVYGHLGALKPYKMANRDVIVAVGGCMTQQSGAAEKLHKVFPFVDIIFGTHNLCDFERLLKEKEGRKKTLIEITEVNSERECIPMKRDSYPNAWVNIIYGCNNFCTYCIVPYVRGREKSRKIAVARLADCLRQASRFQDRETALAWREAIYPFAFRTATKGTLLLIIRHQISLTDATGIHGGT